jgi:hypothetical protein
VPTVAAARCSFGADKVVAAARITDTVLEASFMHVDRVAPAGELRLPRLDEIALAHQEETKRSRASTENHGRIVLLFDVFETLASRAKSS